MYSVYSVKITCKWVNSNGYLNRENFLTDSLSLFFSVHPELPRSVQGTKSGTEKKGMCVSKTYDGVRAFSEAFLVSIFSTVEKNVGPSLYLNYYCVKTR